MNGDSVYRQNLGETFVSYCHSLVTSLGSKPSIMCHLTVASAPNYTTSQTWWVNNSSTAFHYLAKVKPCEIDSFFPVCKMEVLWREEYFINRGWAW